MPLFISAKVQIFIMLYKYPPKILRNICLLMPFFLGSTISYITFPENGEKQIAGHACNDEYDEGVAGKSIIADFPNCGFSVNFPRS